MNHHPSFQWYNGWFPTTPSLKMRSQMHPSWYIEFRNFEWPYLRDGWSDPLLFGSMLGFFWVGGTNGAISSSVKPKMAAMTWHGTRYRQEPNDVAFCQLALLVTCLTKSRGFPDMSWCTCNRARTRSPAAAVCRRAILPTYNNFSTGSRSYIEKWTKNISFHLHLCQRKNVRVLSTMSVCNRSFPTDELLV